MTSSAEPVSTDLRDRLIVALDVPTTADAEGLVAALGSAISFYKIGLELVYGGGLGLAEDLIGRGKKIFLDLKLHDIPTTVERAAAQIAKIGATFATIHAFPQTMAAAKRGVEGSGLSLLAVTVMTSYDDHDLADAGYGFGVRDLVARRADQAIAIGIDGLILSAEEVEAMRRRVGTRLRLVTPGIRQTDAERGDQKRVMTPSAAMKAGADHIVVGRPITQSKDPRAAAEAILAEMAEA